MQLFSAIIGYLKHSFGFIEKGVLKGILELNNISILGHKTPC